VPSFWRKSLGALRLVLMVLLAPFALAGGIVVMIFLAALVVAYAPAGIWQNYKWKSVLKHQGRFRNPSLDVASISDGTLIVDSPTLEWGLCHCWWTPDDVRDVCPHDVPTRDDRKRHMQSEQGTLAMPFDTWCYEKYVHPNNGAAVLLATRHGDRYADRIAEAAPKVDRVESWSAAADMAVRSDSGAEGGATEH